MMIPNALMPNMLKVQRMPLKQIWPIFKRMLGLLKENSTFWTPIVRMVFVNIITFFVFLISIGYFCDDQIKIGAILLGISILLYLMRSFYFGYLFGILSAMVYLYLHGNEVSVKNAKYVIRHRILSLGLLHILANTLGGFFKKKQQQNATPSFISKSLFDSISMEAVDIFGHFLVPVIVIENENLTDSLKHLQHIPQHLSATLSGAIGVNMTRTILSLLFIPVSIAILFGCALIAKYGINFLPQATLFTLGANTYSWLPPALGTLFLFFISSFLRPCMEGLKIIYFTLLYALMAHPEKIQAEKRDAFMGLTNKR